MAFGQPAGLYSIEVNGSTIDIPPVQDKSDGVDWIKQREERRRINRFDKRGMTKGFHQCGNDCNHSQADANSDKIKVVKGERMSS